jgi:hypothetical protein
MNIAKQFLCGCPLGVVRPATESMACHLFLASRIVGLLILGASAIVPVSRPFAQSDPKSVTLPPPGKSWTVFQDDRIECAYAVKPWTPQGAAACMVARGNLIFYWSSTKSQPELQNDKAECSRSSIKSTTDEGGQFWECLRVHGDLIPAVNPTPLSKEQVQTYTAPPQGTPTNTCSNFCQR